MMPTRDCHPFAQGGSGVLLSKAIMDEVGPQLLKCSEMYNDAEHAASMRVTVCMERMYGYINWTKEKYVQTWKSGMHPSSPAVVLTQGNTWDPPGSFHQVTPAEMLELKKGHFAEVENGFYDFSSFAFKIVAIPLTYRRWWQLHFGYAIDNFATGSNRLPVKTDIKTVDGGKTFVQEYYGDITVIVICDSDVPSDVIDVDDVHRGKNTTVWLRLPCPAFQPFYR
jgi:hypothetical protein